MGIVNGGWNVDQEDVNHAEFFPAPELAQSMAADRIYEDTYGPTLEYDVNDVSVEPNILNHPVDLSHPVEWNHPLYGNHPFYPNFHYFLTLLS